MQYLGSRETVQHIFLECNKYTQEREMLLRELDRNKNKLDIRELFQRSSGDVVFGSIFNFLRRTGILGRI